MCLLQPLLRSFSQSIGSASEILSRGINSETSAPFVTSACHTCFAIVREVELWVKALTCILITCYHHCTHDRYAHGLLCVSVFYEMTLLFWDSVTHTHARTHVHTCLSDHITQFWCNCGASTENHVFFNHLIRTIVFWIIQPLFFFKCPEVKNLSTDPYVT